jgi:hypothetical protein
VGGAGVAEASDPVVPSPVELSDALSEEERARRAIAIAAAPASSSQLRASMTRELGVSLTPIVRSKR